MEKRREEVLFNMARRAKENGREMSRLIQEMDSQIERIVGYYVRSVQCAEAFRDDLRLSAMEGIVKAVNRFDFSQRGFLVYVKKSMEMEVRAFLSESIRTVRFPKYIISAIRKINEAEGHFGSLRYVPTEEELMEASGISSKTTFRSVMEARKLQDVFSLDYDYSKDEDGDGLLEGFLSSEEDTEGELEKDSLNMELYGKVNDLSSGERFVIVHSYGLFGKKVLSNREMAEKLDVSVATVINYRNRALASLRTDLAKWSC
ncbi:MAG: sigma-70 family RNA polymerase sigma factor [Spirochaetales bacterium]|nr:sigma-70 family RNA polymerase sigma factor [Candidatus Physcosoma equi]